MMRSPEPSTAAAGPEDAGVPPESVTVGLIMDEPGKPDQCTIRTSFCESVLLSAERRMKYTSLAAFSGVKRTE